MITAADVRAMALSLPRTEEHLIHDHVKFRVGKIVYASISPDELTLGVGFPKEQRAALIDSEPDKFAMPRLSDQRFHWVHARMAALDPDEMRELIIDAWRMVAPKKVAAAHLRGEALRHRVAMEPGNGRRTGERPGERGRRRVDFDLCGQPVPFEALGSSSFARFLSSYAPRLLPGGSLRDFPLASGTVARLPHATTIAAAVCREAWCWPATGAPPRGT